MLAHGIFDYLLMLASSLSDAVPFLGVVLFIVFIYFDVKLWKMGIKRINEMQEASKIQHEASVLENIFNGTNNKNEE